MKNHEENSRLTYVRLLQSAYERYLTLHFIEERDEKPFAEFLTYDFSSITSFKWRPFSALMVEDDLRELTNLINHWHQTLEKLLVWKEVLLTYSENDAWEIRREFVETSVHYCLFQPSALRDTLVFVATQALHQWRLTVDQSYLDYLLGDPLTPNDKPLHPTRRKKEQQLQEIINCLPVDSSLISKIKNIDGDGYREAIRDFRNRASHSIAPRLELGHTRTVVRKVRPIDPITLKILGKNIKGKMQISYAIGGTPPLNLKEVLARNLDEFHLVRNAYSELLALLKKLTDRE